jgi:hypothetical protein
MLPDSVALALRLTRDERRQAASSGRQAMLPRRLPAMGAGSILSMRCTGCGMRRAA